MSALRQPNETARATDGAKAGDVLLRGATRPEGSGVTGAVEGLAVQRLGRGQAPPLQPGLATAPAIATARKSAPSTDDNARRPFSVLLASPRGFCAGVARAVSTVEMALDSRSPGDQRPVFVRHEIVHNKAVVDSLRARGAVFVEDTQEIPEGATAVFSAHGVSPRVRAEAALRNLVMLDATCPLVSRVHAAVLRYAGRGYTVLLVGHAGHPEIDGVMGEAPAHVKLVQSLAEALAVTVEDPDKVAFATQTTLSMDDVSPIVEALRKRFPRMVAPEAGDICYATQNRQEAVRDLVERYGAEVVLVLGSPNSSNSNRLKEVALLAGARAAYLMGDAAELDPAWISDASRVAVTAGASTPEHLVNALLARLRALGAKDVQTVETRVEDVFFATPPMPDGRAPTRAPVGEYAGGA